MVDGTTDPGEQERRIEHYRGVVRQYEGTIVAIEDDITDSAWAEFFAGIHAEKKEIEEWFDTIKAPLNEALTKLRNKESELVTPLKAIENAITQARGNWLRVKQARVAEENKLALEEAKTNGGVALIQQGPTKTVHTSGGASVGLRTQPSWRLVDDPGITAKHAEQEKLEFNRADPRLANVPDVAFILKKGMIMALIKTGQMPEGEHSIEKFDDFASTSK